MTLKNRQGHFAAADLYVAITEAFCAGRPSVEVLASVLDAGVRVVQLREKHLTDGDLFRRAIRFRELTAERNGLFIMNDRLDIALAAKADGVHLGQDDLPVESARQLAPELIIGCSTHSVAEALSAQQAGADYVNIGPIFSTQTKSRPSGAIGPDRIPEIAPHLAIPWTVMGGIKISNIDQVLKQGAKRVAVVTAAIAADDVRAACTALRKKIMKAQ